MENPESNAVLPAPFVGLEPFAHWALATEWERSISNMHEELDRYLAG